MTKYGSPNSLWPAQGGRRRRFSASTMLYTGIASLAVLVAAHSLVDSLVWQRQDAQSLTPTDRSAFSGPGSDTVCWHDWPYIETGCVASPSASAQTAPLSARPVRRVDGRAAAGEHTPAIESKIAGERIAASPTAASTSPSAPGSPSAGGATDGWGRGAGSVRTVDTSASGPTPAPAAAPEPVPAIGAAALSEQDLTFKHGYIQRQAALGHPVDSAPQAAKPPATRKAAHAKPRKDRAAVQVYQLPDGRKVVVHRQYGGYDAARLDAQAGRFRAAENGWTRGSGEPSGERRRWFW